MNPIFDIHEYKNGRELVRLVISGSLIHYPFATNILIADKMMVKSHWISVLHHHDTSYACFDLKAFYICSKIPSPEYARLAAHLLPQEFINYCQLQSLIHNDWLHV